MPCLHFQTKPEDRGFGQSDKRVAPSLENEIVELVVKMAMENQRWGYTRIRDALDHLGHEISRDTVANILKDHGIEPAPERGPHTTWADFLRRHWKVMAATDFFTVEIWSVTGIVRYQVLIVIRLATREVVHRGNFCGESWVLDGADCSESDRWI